MYLTGAIELATRPGAPDIIQPTVSRLWRFASAGYWLWQECVYVLSYLFVFALLVFAVAVLFMTPGGFPDDAEEEPDSPVLPEFLRYRGAA